ncbi:MAG: YhdP family protein [Panacagrimonas sp.]
MPGARVERVRRRWWTAAVSLAAVVLVLGALVTATFQLVMLIAPGYRQDLADYVSRVAKQPVEIGGVSLGWSGFRPRLDLTDITLYGEDGQTPALSATRLRLGFGVTRLVRGDTTPTRVELSGLELFAQIDEQGKFSLRGIDTAGGPARAPQEWLRQLGRFQSVRLRNSEMQLDDARLPETLPRFRLIDAEIEFDEGRGQATAELELPASIGSGVQLGAEIAGDLERPETWNGRWNGSFENLTGLPWIDAALAPGATLGFRDTQLRLDGALVDGKPGGVDVELDAGSVLGRKGTHQAQLSDISLAARLSPQATGWLLDIGRLGLTGVAGPWPETRARVRLERDPDGPSRFEAEAEYLRIADLVPWFDLLPRKAAAGGTQALHRVSGALSGLVLRWDPASGDAGARYSLRADLEALSLASHAESVGFEGLSGTLSASESGGRLSVGQTPVSLRFPKLFENDVAFDSLSGDVAWTRTGDGWEVQVPKLGWQLEGSTGEGALKLRLPQAASLSPHLELDVRFSAPDATRAKRFMPRFWGKELRHWLDTALVAGRVPSARLQIVGELAHFPFVDYPGTFALDLDVADGQLAYAPEWPAIDAIAAHLEFRGMGLAVRADSAMVMGNPVEHAEASIPDLRDAQLSVVGETQGETSRYYDFLRASPLAPRLSGLLTRTDASGEAAVHIDLAIPLKRARDTRVSGKVRLNGVRLDLKDLDEPVLGIRGELAFDNKGASATQLVGEMFSTPVQASIGVDADGGLLLKGAFDFTPDAGGAGVSRFLPAFLRAGMEGRSHWSLALPLNGREAGRLKLSSDLQGLAVNLPQPLKKPAEDAWPIRVALDSEKNFPLRLNIELPERLGADLALAREADGGLRLQRARFRAGPGAMPRADEDGVFIAGTAVDLEPLRWIEAMSGKGAATGSAANAGPSPPVQADLNVGRLWLGGQTVDGVRVVLAPAAGGWVTRLSGEGAQGELTFRNSDEGGVLTGRFERAYISSRRESATATSVREAADKAADEQAAASPVTPIHPGQLPRLDFAADDLRIDKAELGRLDFRTARITDGQRIEQLRTSGPGGAIEVRGEWRRSAGISSADVQFDMKSNAIDQLLAGLGYAPNLKARQSRFRGTLTWPAQSPDQDRGLELGRAEGSLDIDIDKGQLRAVEPGAGRVLGLINFWALPRRLTLDFRDVVSEGLAFDSIKGRFTVGRGNAVTDNLDIQAPSLKMEVRGRVGLAARDYDQRVKVYPDVSAGVTLGALLVGGPIAGVLALIAQEVLDQPLDQVGQLSYRLTGGWDDPQVVREGGLIPGLGRDKKAEQNSSPKIPAQGSP